MRKKMPDVVKGITHSEGEEAQVNQSNSDSEKKNEKTLSTEKPYKRALEFWNHKKVSKVFNIMRTVKTYRRALEFWNQKRLSMMFAIMRGKRPKAEVKSVGKARPVNRKTSSKRSKRPNKGSGQTVKPKAESYFDTKNRTDAETSMKSERKDSTAQISESERKAMSELTGHHIEDVSVVKLPNGKGKYLGRTTRKGPGDTKHAQELMHERAIEGTRMMLYKFFGAWDVDNEVHIADVYDCVFDRDTYKPFQVNRDTFREALKRVNYFHIKGSKVHCTMVNEPADPVNLEKLSESDRHDCIQQMEINVQRAISDYRSQFKQRMLRECVMHPYNNPRVLVRDEVIRDERQKEAEHNQSKEAPVSMAMGMSQYGCEAEHDGELDEDEDLAPGQHYGIYYSEADIADEDCVERDEILELKKDYDPTDIYLINCESNMDRLLKNLVNYGNVEMITQGKFKNEEFIDVSDFGSALNEIIMQVKDQYDIAFKMSKWIKGPGAQEELLRLTKMVHNRIYKCVGQLKGSLERTLRFTWQQMRLGNSLQIEKSALSLTLAILRGADDLTEAGNHFEVSSRGEEILQLQDMRKSAKLKSVPITEQDEVVRAEELGVICLSNRSEKGIIVQTPGNPYCKWRHTGNIMITPQQDFKSQEYDEEVAYAAIVNGEKVYAKQIDLWVDELIRSEMKGSYYFEAIKVLLTSPYRECELRISSVLDRKDNRMSIRKPFSTGATGDVQRLEKEAVAASKDHSVPEIIHNSL
jgi:hypothetical protein